MDIASALALFRPATLESSKAAAGEGGGSGLGDLVGPESEDLCCMGGSEMCWP